MNGSHTMASLPCAQTAAPAPIQGHQKAAEMPAQALPAAPTLLEWPQAAGTIWQAD